MKRLELLARVAALEGEVDRAQVDLSDAKEDLEGFDMGMVQDAVEAGYDAFWGAVCRTFGDNARPPIDYSHLDNGRFMEQCLEAVAGLYERSKVEPVDKG